MVPGNNRAQSPVIVWAHGGGWIGGDKADDLARLEPWVRAGFVVASINYRLSTEAKWPAQVIDFKTAIRAVRANASLIKGWPGKIGIAGASAGGHLAVAAGMSNGKSDWDIGDWPGVSSDAAAVLDDYGPTDLAAWVRLNLWPPSALVVNPLLGGTVDQYPDRALDASPVHWVSPGDPPTYIRYGTADTTVPPSQHIELKNALTAAGVPNTVQALTGAVHADGQFYSTARMNTAAQWFAGVLSA